MVDNRDISTIQQSKGGHQRSHSDDHPGDDEVNEQRTLLRNKGITLYHSFYQTLTKRPVNKLLSTHSQHTLSNSLYLFLARPISLSIFFLTQLTPLSTHLPLPLSLRRRDAAAHGSQAVRRNTIANRTDDSQGQ